MITDIARSRLWLTAFVVSVAGSALLFGCSVAVTEPTAQTPTFSQTSPTPTSSPSQTSPDSPAPTSAPAESTPTKPTTAQRPRLIASARWAAIDIGGGQRRQTLKVEPTEAGREASETEDEQRAWQEVLAFAPGADTPGMRDQFECHWQFARIVDADKATWNLEPWRPVVEQSEMIETQCNPGGPEI